MVVAFVASVACVSLLVSLGRVVDDRFGNGGKELWSCSVKLITDGIVLRFHGFFAELNDDWSSVD